MNGIVIAIDGPAGAGKSTVSKWIADKLGLTYLDTGAMYRAVALVSKRAGLTAEDAEAAYELAKKTRIEFGPGTPQAIFINGNNETTEVRHPEISELASAFSVHSGLRKLLVSLQQEMVAKGNVILEGRDVTTVVAPNATLKVYLTASLEERAKRRTHELQEKGQDAALLAVRRDMENRDHRDMTRDDSPLTLAEGAIIVETAGLTAQEVAEKIISLLPN